MAGNASLNFAIKAINEASKTLREVQSDLDRTGGAAQTSGGHLSTMGGHLSDVAKIAGGFVLGSALTNFPGFLMSAARAAAEDEASIVKLQRAVDNSGVSYSQYADQLDRTVKAAQANAFTDEAARDALSMLVAQTGSATEAQQRFGLAQDLARGASLDLATASRLLGKVTDENINVFGRYGISVEKGTTQTELFGILQEKFGGQAKAFAESSAGAMAVAEIQMSELKETLGRAVLPAITLLAGTVTTVLIPAIDKLNPIIDTLGEHMDVVVPLFGAAATVLTISLIPKLILAISTTWAYVAALTAQAIAFAAANPAAALAAIATAGLVAAYLRAKIQSDEATAAQERFQAAVGGVRDNLLALLPSAQRATDAINDASTALNKFSFAALAAAVAEDAYISGMDTATTANEGLVLQLNAQFERETKIKTILDALTESYTHANAISAAAKAASEGVTAASEAETAALKAQEDAIRKVEAAMAAAQARSDSMAQSFARQTDAARQAGDALMAQLLGMGVSPEDSVAAVRANVQAAFAFDADRIGRAFAAGNITQGESQRFLNALIRGTPDPLSVQLGLVKGLADGGIVRARPGGTLVNVGEGGKDEVVMPLDQGGRSIVIQFLGPVYGMYDFDQKVLSVVRDGARGGSFRGVLTTP